MKLQDVILKAMAKKLTWIEAAEIAGMSVRNMQSCGSSIRSTATTGCSTGAGEEQLSPGGDGDGRPGPELYRDKYADFNARHFHEKLHEVEQIELSYSWVKQALQGAGLVARGSSARSASQAAGTADDAGHVAAHRRKQTSLVPG